MNIKRLELQGFKSFMDRTVLSFEEGITGIVGPNGCGKSNIVDAIFWVMGEQSAKHLRGSSMSDVIFNGSENHQPLNFAEVTLVLSNPTTPGPQEDNRPEYLKYSEIEVTRRLFRSGESEYLINKTHCRLRDVLDLFMDTGVGTKAYSIIEQGQIAKMISAKPEDRRAIIEEAAGVTKYKIRKKESIRKIESTSQNLLRINDIITELEKQLKYLQRQAKKAGDFRGVKDRAKFLDLVLSSKKYNELVITREEKQSAFRALQDKYLSSKTDYQSIESHIEERRVRLIEEEKLLNHKQQKTYELEADIQRKEQTRALKTQELESNQQINERTKSEVTELQESLIRSQQTKDSIASQEVELTNEYKTKSDELRRLESNLQSLNEREFNAEKELEELKTTLHKALSETHRCRQGMEHHKERIAKNIERDQLINRESNEQQKQKDVIAKEVETCKQMVISLELRKRELSQSRLEIENNISDLENNLEEENSLLEKRKDELTHIKSKVKNLEEFQEKYEGYQAGVRELMLNSDNTKFKLLSDLFEVDSGYERAVEAACERRLQQIVVESSNDALEALNFLHKGSKGRASFIPKEWHKMAHPQGRDINGLEFLRPRVKSRDFGAEEIIDWMFHNIYLVDSIENAISIRDKLPNGMVLVTREGDLLSPDGVITGGSEDPFAHQLIVRQQEIENLRGFEEEKTKSYQLQKNTTLTLSNDLQEYENNLESLLKDEHSVDIELVNNKSKLESHTRHLNQLEERISELLKEINALKEERDRLESELADYRINLSNSENKRKESEAELEIKQTDFAKLKEIVNKTNQSLTEFKVKVASIEEKRNNIISHITKTDEACSEIELKLSGHQKEITETDHKRVELIQLIESTKQTIIEMVKKHEEEKRELSEARKNYESLMSELRQFEEQSKGFRTSVDIMSDEVNQATIQLQELKLELQRVEEQIQERYFLNLYQVYEQYKNEELEDAEKAREELEILRNKLRRMGDVNTGAIDEFEEVQKRHEFLIAQRDDLQESIKRLEKTIEKINKVSRKRFEAAYAAVNDKFKKVFPMLFGGGNAELTLTNPENMLESGIEILAKPPGKKLQNITLLSGGEKALTSVSLIFAIFLIKPSPFCLLDEVDAPLDDANIGRFNEMVKFMSKQSQFILITHNKRTMEIGDVLYGVTMEQPGVSRLVSVVLSDARRMNEKELRA